MPVPGGPLTLEVDPDPGRETVTVYRSLLAPRVLSRDDELDGEDVVPGFRASVSDVLET